jgi:hypothetical protein
MRWVRFRVTSCEYAQAAFETKRIRHGADEASARLQHTLHVFDREGRIGQMLEHLARHDDVERLVTERKLVLDIRPSCLDLEPRCSALERCMVDIDADNGVLARIVLRQRAGATTDVQDVESGSADEVRDQPCPFVGAEDELLPVPVVGAVALVESLEPRCHLVRGTHRPSSITARAASSAIRKSHGTR